jgi:hypothetical protein
VDVHGDRPRFLGRTLGYTPVAYHSIEPGAECVDAGCQRELTSRAHRAWARDRRRRWGQAAATIGAAVEDLSRSGDRKLQSDLRTLARAAMRVTAKLDEQAR